ncbi:MAG: Hsp20/alpha crystallin family protein [Candidatus Paceibacterota bacterium]|jgi:HSP20 family protein
MALFKTKIKKDSDKKSGIKVEPTSISETAKKWNASEGQLVVDVYETEEDLVIQSAIAGIKNEDIDIALENDIIIIKGERINPTEDEDKNYFTRECYFGPFYREIIIPREIDASLIDANIKNGMLIIRMPKTEKTENKKTTKEE